MEVKEIEAKSILRKGRRIDSWFVSSYHLNLYRGCSHNCPYCDGRAEKYRVDGVFGRDVAAKINAPEILSQELDPTRKKLPVKPGFMMLGGGVGDAYQPAEKKYKLTRQTLQLLLDYDYPVHILTKSTLVKRDMDIIKRINEQSRAILSFSFSSTNEKTSSVFEPCAATPSERLKTISEFKKEGIYTGMYLMPVLPYITDSVKQLEQSISDAKNAGVDFVVFGLLTLKEGRQKEYYYDILQQHYRELIYDYNRIYRNDKYGNPTLKYSFDTYKKYMGIAAKYQMPKRIPVDIFRDYLSENDLVIVILDQIDFMVKQKGMKSHFGYAAHCISQLKEPISKMRDNLQSIRGVGNMTEKIINEILTTGSAEYYEKLLNE